MRPVLPTAVAIVLGAAALAACSDPHAPARVDRLDCASCHLGAYEAEAARHEPMEASTLCYQCHGTSGWYAVVTNPNRHNRDGDGRRMFRIESGDHAGLDCFQCHVDPDPEDPFNGVPRPPTEFLCADCHEHSRGRTDPRHAGMDDYEHTSNACRRCHRRGEEDD